MPDASFFGCSLGVKGFKGFKVFLEFHGFQILSGKKKDLG